MAEKTLYGLVICTNRKRSCLYGSAEGLLQEFTGTLDTPIINIKVETVEYLFRIVGVDLLQLPGIVNSAEQVHALLLFDTVSYSELVMKEATVLCSVA